MSCAGQSPRCLFTERRVGGRGLQQGLRWERAEKADIHPDGSSGYSEHGEERRTCCVGP